MRGSALLVLAALTIPMPLLAEGPDDPCAECPTVDLVRDGLTIHVQSEDDRDDPRELAHRVRIITEDATSAWTDWSATTSYDLITEIDGLFEAESRDRDGNVGAGLIELTVTATTEPIGPDTVEENSRREARWDEDALGLSGSVIDDEPPPVTASTASTAFTDDFHSASHCPESTCSVLSVSPDDGNTLGLAVFLGALALWARRRR